MRKQISQYSLKKSTEHLLYEVSTFYQTIIFLKNAKNQIEVNILLDDFAIHARNLFDFFYPKKPNLIKDDDMLVTDFLINQKIFNRNKTNKNKLSFITEKANKQVAHLTYKRNRYSKKTKSWPYIIIGREINKTLQAFYDSLSINQKKWKNIIDLKNNIEELSKI